MKYIYLCFFLIILLGCTQKKEMPVVLKQDKSELISDLINISQNVSMYSKNINKGYISSLAEYKKMYFQPWNINEIDVSLENAMWAYKAFTAKNSYGENLQPLQEDFFINMLENSNFKAYSTINKRAITLKKLNIRAFPTERPLLKNPKNAGEGFPFDYMQNSTLAANKPIFVSHYSKDGEWVFIKSSFTFGWVKSRDIVYIQKKYTDIWQNAEQIFILKDDVPVFMHKHDFLFKSTIGTMLPLIDEDDENFRVRTISVYKYNEPYYVKSKLSKTIAHKDILKFNSQNINLIINELLQVNYGWGGIYNQRDCSSTLRDFFAPFGVWLPRNSYQQSRVGKVISLKNMSDEKKIEIIKKNAIPFETLLYKRGHIVLYVGTFNNKIIIFQNVWGVKTNYKGIEGRFIIGKPIFSTLHTGSNLSTFDVNASLLKNLKSMNIITF